uniref:ATP synthase complex subunit 8 n=1 Tax=Tagiades tethys TaxID=76233 RepID=A0A075E6J5_TAGTE|nr:ATP synthase F0 subunit 8 [Daimio tethys]AIC37399.1 ATP synthase F0 subunit 8 [Daimio tethys]AIL31452.1 ATP synthase F0 subunit 8 [Daimio tethys]
MPQMMPINWMISFFMFIFIFILFNILNYYIFNINNKKLNKNYPMKILKSNFYWKW